MNDSRTDAWQTADGYFLPATRKLVGKVLFVTGGAMGFGREFARRFAAEGAAVAVADIDLRGAQMVAEEIEAGGGTAVALDCDVADEQKARSAALQAAERLGGIDFLINNAGRHLLKYNQPFSRLSTNEIRSLFDVNLMGTIHCTLACAPAMRNRGGGSIVNIASIAGHSVASPYGVSKLAVRGLTMAFAHELAVDGIRVNAISPGLMATESAIAELPQAMVDHVRDELQLIHRVGEMQDIAAMALFLCSPGASFVTGETVKVSGGYPLSF